MHNPLIYGMHEPPPPDIMPSGWIVHLVEVGDNPDPHPGVDLSRYAAYGNIVRLQYSWGGGGTIPPNDRLDAYLARVYSCVLNSPDAHLWIPGNEPNHPAEWWGGPDGRAIPSLWTAHVYNSVREIVHVIAGHEQDEVLLPPIAPWVDLSGVAWGPYFQQVIDAADAIDAFALHTYSRGADPASITSQDKMDPPYQAYYNGWSTLYDWLDAIPATYRGAPCYLTETNQNQPWSSINTAWVRELYHEINRHNHSGGQVVRCACLYRWPHFDQYGIAGNLAITSDFQAAQTAGYTWTDIPQEETMLVNPSFEGGWYNQTPDGILVLPEGWRAEYLEGANPWFRPEIKPNQEFVTDGNYSIRAFAPASSRTNFGIYQELDAVPGQWYKFSADVRLESNPPGELTGSVGIQPWGAGIFERAMIWGEETRITLEWVRVEVYAQAFGGRIRVVMGATNKYPTKNNTTWWDNAKLELWECDGGTPPVEPPDPGECLIDYGRIRDIVRDELIGRDPVVWPNE